MWGLKTKTPNGSEFLSRIGFVMFGRECPEVSAGIYLFVFILLGLFALFGYFGYYMYKQRNDSSKLFKAFELGKSRDNESNPYMNPNEQTSDPTKATVQVTLSEGPQTDGYVNKSIDFVNNNKLTPKDGSLIPIKPNLKPARHGNRVGGL